MEKANDALEENNLKAKAVSMISALRSGGMTQEKIIQLRLEYNGMHGLDAHDINELEAAFKSAEEKLLEEQQLAATRQSGPATAMTVQEVIANITATVNEAIEKIDAILAVMVELLAEWQILNEQEKNRPLTEQEELKRKRLAEEIQLEKEKAEEVEKAAHRENQANIGMLKDPNDKEKAKEHAERDEGRIAEARARTREIEAQVRSLPPGQRASIDKKINQAKQKTATAQTATHERESTTERVQATTERVQATTEKAQLVEQARLSTQNILRVQQAMQDVDAIFAALSVEPKEPVITISKQTAQAEQKIASKNNPSSQRVTPNIDTISALNSNQQKAISHNNTPRPDFTPGLPKLPSKNNTHSF